MKPVMHIPGILPEEFCLGYLGRISQLNHLTTRQATFNRLRTYLKSASHPHQGMGPIHLLAEVTGMSAPEFLKRHTLYPLFVAISRGTCEEPHGAAGQESSLRATGMRIGSTHPRCCPSCLGEDLRFWGFSYWRREHQINGVTHCQKHLVPLIKIRDKPGFERCPDRVLSAVHLAENFIADKATSDARHDDFVSRYTAISGGFLDMSYPIRRDAIAALMRQRFRDIGLKRDGRESGEVIGDLIRSKASRQWLLAYFPKILNSFDERWLTAIFEGCTSNVALDWVVLIFTAMYETADDAVNAIREANRQFPPSDSVRRKGPKQCLSGDFWTSRPVLHAYAQAGCTADGVIKKLGTISKTTYRTLDRQGLPSVKNELRGPAGDALRIFFSGGSMADALLAAGSEKESFEKIVRAAGARLSEALRLMDKKEFSAAAVPALGDH